MHVKSVDELLLNSSFFKSIIFNSASPPDIKIPSLLESKISSQFLFSKIFFGKKFLILFLIIKAVFFLSSELNS